MRVASSQARMQLKLKETNISTKHSSRNNPNWQEADQLVSYKHGRKAELESSEKQLRSVVRAGLQGLF